MIITGANFDHFAYVHLFLKSLRENAAYLGKVVVCDNRIQGRWNFPGKILAGKSFTPEQESIILGYGGEIVQYDELLKERKITLDSIDRVPSATVRLPHKFVYSALIAGKYAQNDEVVIYFDSDVFFQKPIDDLFQDCSGDGIFMSNENNYVKNVSLFKQWIEYSDFSFSMDQIKYIEKMEFSEIYCTGFIAGKKDHFHGFMTLCWLLSSNQFVRFFSDQPLVNILRKMLAFPISEISREKVCHVGSVQAKSIECLLGKILVDGVIPNVLHFNGEKINAATLLRFYNIPEKIPPQTVRSKSYVQIIKKILRSLLKS
jgi:hypothetical protein